MARDRYLPTIIALLNKIQNASLHDAELKLSHVEIYSVDNSEDVAAFETMHHRTAINSTNSLYMNYYNLRKNTF